MKKMIEVVAAVLGIVAALATIISSIYALQASGVDIEKKSAVARVFYGYGAFINEKIGIGQATAPADIAAAPSVAAPVAPIPVQPDPASITQETPFKSGDIYISGFRSARRGEDVFFFFSVRNISSGNILIALNGSEDITANTDFGSAKHRDATGIKETWHDQKRAEYYTELSPDSEAFVTVKFDGTKLKGQNAKFNINLVQLVGEKNVRHTFGRPSAIVEQ